MKKDLNNVVQFTQPPFALKFCVRAAPPLPTTMVSPTVPVAETEVDVDNWWRGGTAEGCDFTPAKKVHLQDPVSDAMGATRSFK